MKKHVIIAGILLLALSSGAEGQKKSKKHDYKADEQAINLLIDEYNATEDSCDFDAQAKLMSPDRIFVGSAGEGRETNQEINMRFQKVHQDIVNKEVPGIKYVSVARDRLIKFYGNGTVAVASFFWFRGMYLPPFTPPDIAKRYPQPPARSVSFVLEKQNGAWKIVHTHMSLLYPVDGGDH